MPQTVPSPILTPLKGLSLWNAPFRRTTPWPQSCTSATRTKSPRTSGGFVHNIAAENNSSSSFFIACFRGCAPPTPYVRPILSGVNITHHLPKYVSNIPYASISKWSQMAKPSGTKTELVAGRLLTIYRLRKYKSPSSAKLTRSKSDVLMIGKSRSSTSKSS